MEKIGETHGKELQVALRKQWMQMWCTVADQFANLPAWAQSVLFDDINTAVHIRIAVMQKIQGKQ
jgi:hypothetical protein